MSKEDEMIELAAEACYKTHWGIQITGRYPPVWKDLREETKEFIRKQARNTIEAADLYRAEHKV